MGDKGVILDKDAIMMIVVNGFNVVVDVHGNWG